MVVPAPAPNPKPAAGGDDIRPPQIQAGQPAGMVSDLLAGDLAAGFALIEWLDERDREPLRRNQATILRMAFGRLTHEATQLVRRVYPDRIPAVVTAAVQTKGKDYWDDFVASVTELFALDLYRADDVIRFVSAVIWPPGPAAG